MEASKRIEHGESGSVRAIGDRLVIEEMVIEDERAARVVRERANGGLEPATSVRDAIEIGVRVLEREGTAGEVDYVKHEFERTAGEVREQFTTQARGLTETVQAELERVFADDGGAMSKALEAHADELAEQLTRHFGKGSSEAVQHQVKAMVEATMGESREALIRHLSSDEGSNPLADFKAGINRTLTEAVRALTDEEKTTRERLDALGVEMARLTEQAEGRRQIAEVEAAGTRKGLAFEELVLAAIEAIAAARGDAVTHSGPEQAEGGGRKGDILVELGAADGSPCGRVVFEVKDKRLSKNQAWAELNEGMASRAAAFAVLVVADEDRVPAGREQLAEYEGNKMIVAVDRDDPGGLALEVAYRLAAARTLMARDAELEVDAVAVRDSAAEAVTMLKQAQAIRSTLTGIKTSADKARGGLDAMVEDVRAKLERIESLVAEAE
jgi:Uncharacterized protein conserved in bacteria (DUF2130)